MPKYFGKDKSVLVTGAAGFLGSKLVLALAEQDVTVHALVRNPLAGPLLDAFSSSPNIHLHLADISDKESLSKVLPSGEKVNFVFHLAAFWDFKPGQEERFDRVNQQGTINVVDWSERHGIDRLIFASTILAASTSGSHEVITEETPPNIHSSQAYARSKAWGEQYIQHNGIPHAIVRLSGIFDMGADLPPLAAAIGRCSVPGPLGMIVPGKGQTGLSYLHRRDAVELMLQVIYKHPQLDRSETLLSGPEESITHQKLFPMIRSCFELSVTPIYTPLQIIKFGLQCKILLRKLTGLKPTFEDPSMLDYIDNPLQSNPNRTYEKLQWKPSPECSLEKCLPRMIDTIRDETRKGRSFEIRTATAGTRIGPRLPSNASLLQITKSSTRSLPRAAVVGLAAVTFGVFAATRSIATSNRHHDNTPLPTSGKP